MARVLISWSFSTCESASAGPEVYLGWPGRQHPNSAKAGFPALGPGFWALLPK